MIDAPALMKKIYCAVDFKRLSRVAAGHAATLADCLGAEITLVHVYSIGGITTSMSTIAPSAEDVAAASNFAQEQLTALAQQLRSPKRPVETLLLVAGASTGRTITERAHNDGVDLIVLGSHGRSALERFFVGSVAREVIDSSTCPVLLTPDPKVDATS